MISHLQVSRSRLVIFVCLILHEDVVAQDDRENKSNKAIYDETCPAEHIGD